MMDDLKQLALIGLGGTALAVEKLTEKVDELVEQGKLTVKEGKELTEELVQENKDEAKKEGTEKVEKLLDNLGIAHADTVADLVKRVKEIEKHLGLSQEEPTEEAVEEATEE